MREKRLFGWAGVVLMAALLGLSGCKGSSGGSSAASSAGGGSSTTPTRAPAPTPPPETPPAPVPEPVAGKAELIWSAPTLNEDGSALTNLAGYTVRYGKSAGSLDQTLDVAGAGKTSVVIEGLSSGTWYFTVASYTNAGVESAPAGPVYRTIG